MNWRKAILVAFFAHSAISGGRRLWRSGHRDVPSHVATSLTFALLIFLAVTA